MMGNLRRLAWLAIVVAGGYLILAWAVQIWPFAPKPKPNPSTLTVRIKGLAIVETVGHTMQVNLMKGSGHTPYLSFAKGMITSSTTAPTDDTLSDETGREGYDLSSVTSLTLDIGNSTAADLTKQDDAITDQLPAVNDDDHWKSVRYAARLGVITNATKITDRSQFYPAQLVLSHGTMKARTPKSVFGRSYTWTFQQYSGATPGNVVVTQAMSDTLANEIPVSGTTATFKLDGNTVVIDLTKGDVLLRNSPPKGTTGVCKGLPSSPTMPQTGCVDHLAMLYALTDAPTPYPVGVGNLKISDPGLSLPGAEPDYCPPAVF